MPTVADAFFEHAQVGLKRLIDRRGHGDDKKIDLLECLGIRGKADIFGGREFRLGHLAGTVPPRPQFRYPLGIDVKPEDRKVPWPYGRRAANRHSRAQ